MKEYYALEYKLVGENEWKLEKTFDAFENRSQEDMDKMIDYMYDLKRPYPEFCDFRLVYRKEQILASTLKHNQ